MWRRIQRFAVDWLKEHLLGAIAGAVVAALAAGWWWIWDRFNPEFEYRAQPSVVAPATPAAPSGAAVRTGQHWVALGQILDRIRKDSQVYCSGGWDERIARIGLRRCDTFRFEPPELAELFACSPRRDTASIATSDQLRALRYYDDWLGSGRCLAIRPGMAPDSYIVTAGNQARPVRVQFGNDPPRHVHFCGCNDAEIGQIAVTMNARLP